MLSALEAVGTAVLSALEAVGTEQRVVCSRGCGDRAVLSAVEVVGTE